MTRRIDSGVTLIEMMIVLAVIGVATGAATLGLGALGRDNAAEREARRLATAMGFAVDGALISGVPRVMTWDAQGYQIEGGARRELGPGVMLARADGVAERVTLSADATGAVDFMIQGQGPVWRVAFDGLSARALPGDAP